MAAAYFQNYSLKLAGAFLKSSRPQIQVVKT